MDLSEIRKLVRLMIRAELTELEIDDSNKGLRVHLKRGSSGRADERVQPVVQVMGGGQAPAGSGESFGGPASLMGTGGGPGAGSLETDDLPPGTVPFESPMVGTFYRAASPDAEPFVEPGTRVDEDTVVCIVEAMKVMNEIKAEMRGEIVEVLVENGEPVEFGQPLFLLKKA